MPLFFFISGYLFNAEKHLQNGSLFLKTRFKRLIFPCIKYNLFAYLTIVFLTIFYGTHRWNLLFLKPFFQIIKDFCILTSQTLINAPLWFLPCLFLVEMLYYLLYKLSRGNKVILILLTVLLYLSGYFYSGNKLPWSLNIAAVATLFYAAGHLFKTSNLKLNYKVAALSFGTYLIFIYNYIMVYPLSKIDLNKMAYSNEFYLLPVIACSAILCLIYIFTKYYEVGYKQKAMEFFGRNSLSIMGLHYPTFWLLEMTGNYSGPVKTIFTLTLISIALVLKSKLEFKNLQKYRKSAGLYVSTYLYRSTESND